MIRKIQLSTQDAVQKMGTVVERAYSDKELATEAVAAINEVDFPARTARSQREHCAECRKRLADERGE